MKIAQIAPLIESVPPKGYGGTERVVYWLTEELVRQGHEVTLFASGDSETSAELVPCSEAALRLDPRVKDALPHHILMLEEVRQRAHEFDVLHFHIDYMHFPLSRQLGLTTVTTLHGRLDLPDLIPIYKEFPDMPLVSISNHQRLPMPPVNWVGTVYHGMPLDLLSYCENPSRDYLAFLGRISPEKGPDRAIEIAKRCGIKLKMAAKVDKVDQEYFDTLIKPMLDHPLIEFTGEFDDRTKASFLGNALAVLFPINWPEPFGLVMTEAMACGTPVIAYRCGSVPEVIDHGVTGLIVDDVDDAVRAVRRASMFDRWFVRKRFEQRFSAGRMTHDYVAIYRQLAETGKVPIEAA